MNQPFNLQQYEQIAANIADELLATPQVWS